MPKENAMYMSTYKTILYDIFCKIENKARSQWHMPVIIATQEAKIWRMEV
jgi:hypothetical protein